MQTVSREMGEKLREKGWKKQCNFYWTLVDGDKWEVNYIAFVGVMDLKPNGVLPAPTLAELLEEFPEGSQFNIDYVVKPYPEVKGEWNFCRLGVATATSDNLAEAAAQVWWLGKEGR